MYAALTHTLDCVADPTLACIDVECMEPRQLSMDERARLACERAEALAAKDEVQPPWRFCSERFSILEAECEARCVSIADYGKDRFLTPLLSTGPPDQFVRDLPSLLPLGRAALRESHLLAQLRQRLVPAACSEDAFWYCFFTHVRDVRTSLLPPSWARPVARSASEEARAEEDEFERFLASPLPYPGGIERGELAHTPAV
eukprot:CAMPEP_0115845414 /NCGR_PEP_ID=MMETSP0287-20121206/9340_1 /TAXON_ID=412157 /ORGANISM="Chrysochromulina rotalis, Strain UIO044" /LENGTH=200 /DNA_ID=CAMNT_0003299187 /DNA_START=45 /DNA_END=647 /DNA_ORIENTATION=-